MPSDGQPVYLPRVVDYELDLLLPDLAAIAIEGPRAVGKTATALQRAGTVWRLDEPEVRQIIEADPQRAVTGGEPILIDEWQLLPRSWDLVRRAVDADSSPGRFLLTGSATPDDHPTHPGAGRIVSVRMRPMALYERGIGGPTVSLADLLTGTRPRIEGSTDVNLVTYAEEVVASGYPGLRGLGSRSLRVQIESYLSRLAEHDLPVAGLTVRHPQRFRRWMAAYAAATGTTASFEVIREAASSGEEQKPAKSTTQPYRDALERLWIVDPIPAWLPTRNNLSRLAAPPKHQLADPALAARLLGANVEALLDARPLGLPIPRQGPLLGAMFESLVALGVRVAAQAAEARVGHLRTWSGDHEVDLIVERGDHRVVAIEVKLKQVVKDRDVRHLHWLRDRIGDDLLDAAIVTTGREAYRRTDGIAVVPAALLGP